jgi:5-methylcytosine-specific restriction endonuclease McrA
MSRVIPSWVKQDVFKRDKGKCVLCGSADQLHFDHDFPYSKGGTSLLPENVRLLCARHNLEKAAKIE